MCATRDHVEVVPANDLRPGDVLLDRRHFQVGDVSHIGGKIKLTARRNLAEPIWLDACDRVQVVAA